MDHEQKVALVDALYASTGVGDWETAETMLTDDLVIVEADGLPMAGIYSGRTALQDLYTRVFGLVEAKSLNRVQTTTGGDYAVTILSIEFADPSLEPAELCEMFRFRDGKVCEIKPFYFDQAPVIAAAEAFKKKNG